MFRVVASARTVRCVAAYEGGKSRPFDVSWLLVFQGVSLFIRLVVYRRPGGSRELASKEGAPLLYF